MEAALVDEGVLDYPTYTQSDTELRQTRVSETTTLGLTLYGGESHHNNCPFLGSIIYILPFQVTASPFGEGIEISLFFSTTQLDTQVCHKGIDSLTC